ncbi:uncharacterized protein LOC129600675 isoform X2 [Paramacrobiotus metropolitanus]|uniref:uncharacterized protein LOC129600675 isoform X2 n=1 Tax=Paramacrobiotus metropolitanus TaxID=2943436 RepID=UPI0024457C1D|nr:uncharacterized protein LOC129600675 isoform X2 [Paramacrobiotus metropolitanus]
MMRRTLAGSLYWRRGCGRAAGAVRRSALRRPLRTTPAAYQTVAEAEAGLPLYDHIINQTLRAFTEQVPICWRYLGRQLAGIPCGIPNGQVPVRREGTKPDTGGGARPGGCLLASVGSRFPGAVRRLPLVSPRYMTVRRSSKAFVPQAPVTPADARDLIERLREKLGEADGQLWSSVPYQLSGLTDLVGVRFAEDSAEASAESGSFPVEEVVAALQREGYAAVRVQLARLFSVADELAPRQCLRLASACQLILLQRRSRLKVLSATLTAPGELSDTAQRALQDCVRAERHIVLDVAGRLNNLMGYAVEHELREELQSAVEPLIGQLWTGGNREEMTSRLLTGLDTLLSAVGCLIRGHELPPTLDLLQKPPLIRDLDQLAALVEASVFPPDVQLAVGRHSDYADAEWRYFVDHYDGPCRIAVHMGWVYAVLRATSVHGGAASELMDAVKRGLNAKRQDFMSQTEVDLKDVVDRLGCGVLHPRKPAAIVEFSGLVTGEFNEKNPDVLVLEIAFTHEQHALLFIEAANLLGPATNFQYCLALKVNDRSPETSPFYAALYVFKRVANPCTKPPTRSTSCRPAHEGLPVGSGHPAEYEVSGERVTNEKARNMSVADIRRIFDMEMVFRHRADDSNLMDPVEFRLDIQYPDGSWQVFSISLGIFFPYVRGLWVQYFKKQAEIKAIRKSGAK